MFNYKCIYVVVLVKAKNIRSNDSRMKLRFIHVPPLAARSKYLKNSSSSLVNNHLLASFAAILWPSLLILINFEKQALKVTRPRLSLFFLKTFWQASYKFLGCSSPFGSLVKSPSFSSPASIKSFSNKTTGGLTFKVLNMTSCTTFFLVSTFSFHASNVLGRTQQVNDKTTTTL